MTLNRDLFLAILSMDSYNRGYGVGVKKLSETGTLGGATLLAATAEQQRGWQAAGFYALAYDMTGVSGFAAGERVISYRGSDNIEKQTAVINFLAKFPYLIGSGFNILPTDDDVTNGYGVAFGYPDGIQARLSIEFFRAVAGATLEEANITVTGHSLGGGLAGLVAGIYNRPGFFVDPMPCASNDNADCRRLAA
jgi:hypothetical protein